MTTNRKRAAYLVLAAVLSHACTAPTQPDPPPPVQNPAPPPPPAAAPPPAPQPSTPAPPPPPSSTARMEWSLSDGCNDGRGIAVRLFDKSNNLVWPGGGQYWYADPGRSVDVVIACQRSARICFGAETEPRTSSYWGVGLDGNRGCDACCFTCGDIRVSRNLVCG